MSTISNFRTQQATVASRKDQSPAKIKSGLVWATLLKGLILV
jgi:hypothetical protein